MSRQRPKSPQPDSAAEPPKPAPGGKPGPALSKNNTGRVQFDERGTAVWQWAVSTGAFGTGGTGSTSSRLRKLDNKLLSLAEDAPTPVDVVKANPKGLVKGYSPYDSGVLVKGAEPRTAKKDLRRLSEWMKLRQQPAGGKPPKPGKTK